MSAPICAQHPALYNAYDYRFILMSHVCFGGGMGSTYSNRHYIQTKQFGINMDTHPNIPQLAKGNGCLMAVLRFKRQRHAAIEHAPKYCPSRYLGKLEAKPCFWTQLGHQPKMQRCLGEAWAPAKVLKTPRSLERIYICSKEK